MSSNFNDNFETNLAVVETPESAYLDGENSLISDAIERMGTELGWAREGKGPFGALIPAGARVLIKPNWVLHHNQGNGGMDPMITHGSVVRAVVRAALQADPAEVLVGDAPIQTCDFPALLEESDWLSGPTISLKQMLVFAA